MQVTEIHVIELGQILNHAMITINRITKGNRLRLLVVNDWLSRYVNISLLD